MPDEATYLLSASRDRSVTVERPDPVSRSQPQGVHGPSAVVEREFPWSDAGWPGRPLGEYAVYELHVGTFTPAGTFDAVVGRLDALVELGITAIEIMPVAQFPGERNSGLRRASTSVRPPAFLRWSGGAQTPGRRLPRARARRGARRGLQPSSGPRRELSGRLRDPASRIAIERRGALALNFDGHERDDVRRYFCIANAARNGSTSLHRRLAARRGPCHLRQLGATFLRELADAVLEPGPGNSIVSVFARSAETNRNNPVSDAGQPRRPGAGCPGVVDDFGSATTAMLTGEQHGFYSDFGNMNDVAEAMREGYILTGQYSRYRRRRHGVPRRTEAAEPLLVFAEVTTRWATVLAANGWAGSFDFEQLETGLLAAMFCYPLVPLLFMGEEYDDPNPFYYFISHSDPGLIEAVRASRRRNSLSSRLGLVRNPPTLNRGKLSGFANQAIRN